MKDFKDPPVVDAALMRLAKVCGTFPGQCCHV